MLPILLSLLTGLATAQTLPRTTPLEVLALDEAGPCPDVPTGTHPLLVRTSVGVFRHDGDGSFDYLCPTQLGGDVETERMAASPDGEELVVIAGGEVFRSTDGGCASQRLALPEGLEAVDVLYFRLAFYVLAASSDTRVDSGALLRWDGSAFLAVHEWKEDFEPFGMGDADPTTLWVTAVRPLVSIDRVTFQGGLQTSGPLLGLPPDTEGTTSIEMRGGDADEAWFVLQRGARAWTWHARIIDGSANLVIEVGEAAQEGRTIFGPVKKDAAWWAVIDTTLFRAAELAGEWTATGRNVPWTCLHKLGDRVFACTVPTVELLTSIGGGAEPATTPVFSLKQMSEPVATCSDPTCDMVFADVLAGADRSAEDPVAACPDGRTLAELGAEECTCAQGGRGALLGLWGLLLVGLRRRR
ncbi:MAG: hypothetical protein H6732_07470 [Alphaproteobacteria bacterium]|nr:hypothetical protein [Alphaproteobacteria bacterium]